MRTGEFIEKIEARLSTAGKNVEDLCREAEIARSTWTRWKSGATSPTVRTLDAVEIACDALCSGGAADVEAAE